MQFTFKIWTKIKEAWGLYKENFSNLLILTIFSFIIQIVLGQKGHTFLKVIFYVFNILISYVWISSSFELVDKRIFNPFTKNSFPSWMQFWKYFGTILWAGFLSALPVFIIGIIFILAVVMTGKLAFLLSLGAVSIVIFVIAFIVIMIPSFYITGRLLFSKYISIEKNLGALKSVKESWGITEGYAWKLFGYSLLIGIFCFLGIIAILLGLFITYPISMILQIMLYREFIKAKGVKVVKNEDTPKEIIEESK
jgi:hypothetical protein